LIDFPVFNVADIFVTCATALLMVLLLFYYKDEDLECLHVKKSGKGDGK
jgi:signal peptidase II